MSDDPLDFLNEPTKPTPPPLPASPRPLWEPSKIKPPTSKPTGWTLLEYGLGSLLGFFVGLVVLVVGLFVAAAADASWQQRGMGDQPHNPLAMLIGLVAMLAPLWCPVMLVIVMSKIGRIRF